MTDARPAHAPEVTWDPAQKTVILVVIYWVTNSTQHKAAFRPRTNEACVQAVRRCKGQPTPYPQTLQKSSLGSSIRGTVGTGFAGK